MITIYVHPKCSTCKNALNFLKSRLDESQYSVVDITKTPPTLAELSHMLKVYKGNFKKLFNTSGIQYRELGLSEKLKTMTEDEALKLLSQNGMLVKRPFLISKSVCCVGFKENLSL